MIQTLFRPFRSFPLVALAAGLLSVAACSPAAAQPPAMQPAPRHKAEVDPPLSPYIRVQPFQEDDQCKAQPTYVMCLARANTLVQVDFTPSDDGDGSIEQDVWRTQIDHVMKGEAWTGDCDDLSNTTADFLMREGIPPYKIFLLGVSVKNKHAPDHMVAVVEAADGHFWVVGDAMMPNHIYRLEDMPWTLYLTMPMDQGVWLPGDWTRGDPSKQDDGKPHPQKKR